jgi:DNA-binding transcriptional ArsR family regulator
LAPGADLARAVEVTPSAVSQHIAVLRDAGLIATHRDGRHVIAQRTELGDRFCQSCEQRLGQTLDRRTSRAERNPASGGRIRTSLRGDRGISVRAPEQCGPLRQLG